MLRVDLLVNLARYSLPQGRTKKVLLAKKKMIVAGYQNSRNSRQKLFLQSTKHVNTTRSWHNDATAIRTHTNAKIVSG